MRDTIDMAREAGLTAPEGYQGTGWFWGHDNLKAFEALVRADEREACAKVCESHIDGTPDYNQGAWDCAEAIRERSANAGARGETK